MTLKIMHTGDIHLDTIHHGRENPRTGLNYVMESNKAVVTHLVNRAIEEEVDLFLVAGDNTTTANPTIETVLQLHEILEPLTAAGIPIAIDEGNHEYLYIKNIRHRSPATALGKLLETHNTDAQEKVHVSTSIDLVNYEAFDLLSIPYPHKASILAQLGEHRVDPTKGDGIVVRWVLDQIAQLLAKRDDSIPLLMTGHLTVDGIGLPGSEQDIANLMNECVFPVKALEEFGPAYIGLGHIHTPQQVGDKTFYAGSPNKLTFTDAKDTKHGNLVTIADDGTFEVEHVETPVRGLHVVDLSKEEFTLELKENDVVKVRLPEGETTISRELRKQFRDARASAILDPRPVQRKRIRERVILPETISPESALIKHLESNGYSQEEIKPLVAKAKTLGVGGSTK